MSQNSGSESTNTDTTESKKALLTERESRITDTSDPAPTADPAPTTSTPTTSTQAADITSTNPVATSTEIKEDANEFFEDSIIAEKYKTPHEIAIQRLGSIHEHCAKILKMYKLLRTECFIPQGFEMNKLLDFNNITSFDEILKTKVGKMTTIDKKLACFPILVDALYILFARLVDETAPFIMMPRTQLGIQLQVNAMGRSKYFTQEQHAAVTADFLNFITEPTMKNILIQHIPYIIANNFSISDVELIFKRNINLHIKKLIATLIMAAYKKEPAKIPQDLTDLIEPEPESTTQLQKN